MSRELKSSDDWTDEAVSTLHNQKQSPLLRLPAELRNWIYEYALGSLTIRKCLFRPHKFRAFDTSRQERTNLTALASTCRQLYGETRLLPFELNVFKGHVEYWPRVLRDGLSESQRNSLRSIEITRSSVKECRPDRPWSLTQHDWSAIKLFGGQTTQYHSSGGLPNLCQLTVVQCFYYDCSNHEKLPALLEFTDLLEREFKKTPRGRAGDGKLMVVGRHYYVG